MPVDDGTKGASHEPPAGDQHGPVDYEIRVKGHLDPRWASRFSGLGLTTADDGTTVVHGPVIDQAALHGLLQQLRDMGMPLLSVTPARADGPDVPATDTATRIHERNLT